MFLSRSDFISTNTGHPFMLRIVLKQKLIFSYFFPILGRVGISFVQKINVKFQLKDVIYRHISTASYTTAINSTKPRISIVSPNSQGSCSEAYISRPNCVCRLSFSLCHKLLLLHTKMDSYEVWHTTISG